MTAFTPEQQAEITRIIEQREGDGRHGVLIRQLQGRSFAPGDLKATLATTAPAGWLMLQGQTVNPIEATYPDLAAALGVTGSYTFPDARGRALIGAGTGAGLTTRTLGTSGGEEAHLLSVPEIPGHTHTPPVGSEFIARLVTGGADASMNVTGGTVGVRWSSNANTSTSGGGGTHNNMQPWLAANLMVKT